MTYTENKSMVTVVPCYGIGDSMRVVLLGEFPEILKREMAHQS